MQEEEFRDVIGYEGLYQISNLGNVKSLARLVYNDKGQYLIKERFKKLFISKSGYYIVSLHKNKKGCANQVHQLIAEAFLGHKRCGYKSVVDHIDNNPLNNNVNNLQLITHRLNNSKDRKNVSGYTGVYWERNKWRARLNFNGKKIHLGYFTDKYDAHLVYQNKLKELKLC